MDGSQRKVKQNNEDGTVSTRDMMGIYFERIAVLAKNKDAFDSASIFLILKFFLFLLLFAEKSLLQEVSIEQHTQALRTAGANLAKAML